nr:hypothetical protein [Tanacetum cinerariifolium]
DYALESAARILNMVPTKKVDKTPYELWYGKVPNLSYLKVADFLEKDFILQKESGGIVDLEDEDILPSENTSEHPIEEENLNPIISQEEDVILVRRSVRTHKAPGRLCLNVEIDPDRLCFNIEVEEHSLGDLNEPANYKAALSDPEFEKMDNSKRGSIPKQVYLHLSKSQCATTSVGMKRSIMYVVRCTRPDVVFAQNITSRFQQNSGEAHWTAVKNILKYLRNTKDTFLVYGGDPEAELRVNCYCDVGFETDRDDTKSQTGYVFVLNGGAEVWKSSKQSTTAQHAT